MQATDDDIIRALTHPLRREVLRVLNSSTKPLGPQQIEDILRLPEGRKEMLNSVSYHVRALWRRKVIHLVGEEPARGARRHLYKSLVAEVAWVMNLLERTQAHDEAQLWPEGRNQKD